MKTWTSPSGLLLIPRADDVPDSWVLSLLSSVADRFETLELGVWRIREGNACVSLELSLLVMELASPVTLRGILLASCPCRGCSVSCACYLSPCMAGGSNIPVLIPFTHLGCSQFVLLLWFSL